MTVDSLQGEASTIATIVQLSLGPVFLIVGIGGLLNVLTSRLGRVVDRTRAVESETRGEAEGKSRTMHVEELNVLDQRIVRINTAIILCTFAQLLVCLVVVALFTSQFVDIVMDEIVAGLFIAAMLALIVALGFFLSEINVAGRMLRVSTEFRTRRRRRL